MNACLIVSMRLASYPGSFYPLTEEPGYEASMRWNRGDGKTSVVTWNWIQSLPPAPHNPRISHSVEFWWHTLLGVVTKAFSTTCAVYIEDCWGWRLSGVCRYQPSLSQQLWAPSFHLILSDMFDTVGPIKPTNVRKLPIWYSWAN